MKTFRSFILVLIGLALVGCGFSRPTEPASLIRNPQPATGIPLTPTFTPFQPLAPVTNAAPSTAGIPTPAQPSVQAPAQPAEQPPTRQAVQTPAQLAVQTPASSAALPIWIDAQLPALLKDGVKIPPGLTTAPEAEEAALNLVVGDQRPISRWVYALASPFPELEQGISSEKLRKIWHGEVAGAPLYLDESTLAVFSALWGGPASEAVRALPASELLEKAWNNRPAWAILPFETLEPRWKVLEVDGISPIQKDFDPAAYALTAPISLDGEPSLADVVMSQYGPDSATPLAPSTNRDSGRLTTLVMTGTTALVRATAYTMEQKGVNYPGRDVGDWLRGADLTHISNEVPFAKNCPFPNPVQEDMRFCSDPRYIGLLEDMGTDIVELTGDHFQDWGEAAMNYTLDLYRERGWEYYGGGANLEDARKAITVEHNGNRLAFIGCNAKGGSFAQAGPKHPGAVVCDEAWMQAEIARLRGEGFLPVVTFQHYEYYTYQAQPNQKKDFRAMAEAGAVIVSGSQAHQPQGMEFDSGAFIHYGLGNLFFDQYDVSLACRQAFIDRHVFYGGRYISTELLPIMFVDYARPRLMTDEERSQLLQAVFRASGW